MRVKGGNCESALFNSSYGCSDRAIVDGVRGRGRRFFGACHAADATTGRRTTADADLVTITHTGSAIGDVPVYRTGAVECCIDRRYDEFAPWTGRRYGRDALRAGITQRYLRVR
jgi:hypothetical protein